MTSRISRIIILAAVVGLGRAPSPLFGAAETLYRGSDWSLLDAHNVMTAAEAITSAKFPDCDEATVDQKLMRVVHEDGTGESQDETFTKVLTEVGKRNHTSLSLNFMLPYSTVEVSRLEIIKPNGDIGSVDIAANSKESTDDSQMAENIYDPNSRVLQVNIPHLEIGDVLHTVTRSTTERPIMPGEYSEEEIFEGEGYIRHTSYEIRAPASKPLKHIELRDEVPGTITASTRTEADGTLVYHWEVNRVPRMYAEPAMPSYGDVLQRVSTSTTADWAALSRWYWELSVHHLEAITPEMKRTAGELTAKAKSDEDRLKAVFYYVSKNIRYMGITPEKDRPGFEPHDVSLTFEKKYGVCRDKAALLVALLRSIGFTAYPALANIGSKMDPETPSLDFNHAIVAVERSPGSYVLMDPTDENTQELLPASDGNQNYLVCRPEGDTLRLTPIEAPEENMVRITTGGLLDESGTLEAKTELLFEGVNDNAARAAFSEMKPSEEKRAFQQKLDSVMPGTIIKALKITPADMKDTSSSVRVEIEFSVANATRFGKGNAVVNLPWLGDAFGVVNSVLEGVGLEKRKYPLETQVACGVTEAVAIKLADGFTQAVSMPTYPPVDNPEMSEQRRLEFKDHVLIGARQMKIKVVEFSPEQYLQLKRTLQDLQTDQRKLPILAVGPNLPKAAPEILPTPAAALATSDFTLIEKQTELRVKDAHTSLERVRTVKKILTENGKKEQAEVKIEYNPATEEARLIRAVVISPAGQRQEISPDELHVLDAEWNASAKRYTGGKILVANLPGVEIGSTIEVELEIATHDVPFISGFEEFQGSNERELQTYQVSAPAELKFQKWEYGPPGMLTAESKIAEGRQVLLWKAENIKALGSETGLPPVWIYAPCVEVFFGNTQACLQEMNRVMLERSAKSSQATALARRLTAGVLNRRDAIRAIRDHVAKAIRVSGPSFTDLPLSELSDADTTLADGYGHLADRAILLHAMLTAAGFKPEFVLASGTPPLAELTRIAERSPLSSGFQTPLVKIELEGEALYLNDTDQYSELGATGFQGKRAVQLSNQSFATVQVVKDRQSRTTMELALSFTDTGTARVQVIERSYGMDFGAKRQFFAEVTPEDRKRYFQDVVSRTAQGARPVGELTTKFDTYPGVEEFTVEIDHYAVVDGRYFYFDLPIKPSFSVDADQRTLPLYIDGESETWIQTKVELPPGYRSVAISPGSLRFAAPQNAVALQISANGTEREYLVNYRLSTSPAILPPEDYPALVKLESALENKSARFFLLERDGK